MKKCIMLIVVVLFASLAHAQLLPSEASRPPQAPNVAFVPGNCDGSLPLSDVPCPTVAPFNTTSNWIYQIYYDGITAGCTGSTYCPDNTVTRAQMAIFLGRLMHGTENRRIFEVNPLGSNAATNGTFLRTVVGKIDSAGDASSTHGYLIKIFPGEYDLGSTPLSIPSYVDVEGSGADVTYIHGAPTAFQPVLYLSTSELRQIRVKNTYGGGLTVQASAVDMQSETVIRDAVLEVAAGGTVLYQVNYTARVISSDLLAKDGGVAVNSYSGTRVLNSRLIGGLTVGGILYLANSEYSRLSNTITGSPVCRNCFNSGWVALGSNCQ
jgi:hypothetical protein